MDFSPHADDFVAHYDSVRGRVRLALLLDQLKQVLPAGATVLDVGGGAGHLAALLAEQGHRVTIVEPSAKMRQAAVAVVPANVAIQSGSASDIPTRTDAGTYDAVLCHAVAPYVDDLDALVRDVIAGAAPGGIVSIVIKNREALAMRPALEGRWSDVARAIEADGDAGGLGVRSRAHSLGEVDATLRRHGWSVTEWWAVRTVSDGLHDEPLESVDDIIAAERALAGSDPYRRVGRLLHLVASTAAHSDEQ